jgi:hypothetical protein
MSIAQRSYVILAAIAFDDTGLLCPQHGALYRGADVGRFIDWFGALKVGVVGKRR